MRRGLANIRDLSPQQLNELAAFAPENARQAVQDELARDAGVAPAERADVLADATAAINRLNDNLEQAQNRLENVTAVNAREDAARESELEDTRDALNATAASIKSLKLQLEELKEDLETGV